MSKKLSLFRTLLALSSNQSGNIRFGFTRNFLMEGAGEGGEGGGGEGGKETPPKEGEPDKDGKYPKEFVEKLLREKANFKTKATELETKVKELESNKPAPKKADDNNSGNDDIKAMLKAEQDKRKELEDKLAKEEAGKKDAMKLGALKREFLKNGGNDKSFELVQKLADTQKVFIDEDSQIVYGAETEVKRLKELAPQLFGKSTKGTDQTDNSERPNLEVDGDNIFEGKRLTGKGKVEARNALVDFYSGSGIVIKK